MDDFFKKLFEQGDEPQGRSASDPSFDFHDFKAWLDKNSDDEDSFNEQSGEDRKDKLRSDFRNRVKAKMDQKKRRSE